MGLNTKQTLIGRPQGAEQGAPRSRWPNQMSDSDALSPPESGGEDEQANPLNLAEQYESSTDIETDPENYDSNPEEPEPEVQQKKVIILLMNGVPYMYSVPYFLQHY